MYMRWYTLLPLDSFTTPKAELTDAISQTHRGRTKELQRSKVLVRKQGALVDQARNTGMA